MARITFLREDELSALVNLVDTVADHVAGISQTDGVIGILDPRSQEMREQRIVEYLNLHTNVDFRIWRRKHPGRKQ